METNWLEVLQGIAEEQKKLQESIQFNMPRVLEAISAAVSPYQELVNRFTENIDKIKPAFEKLTLFARESVVIDKLGANVFVMIDQMPMEFIDKAYDEQDADRLDALIEQYLITDDGVKTVYEACRNHELLSTRALFIQSEDAYYREEYEIAIIGLTAVLDGLLSECAEDVGTGLKYRADKLEELTNIGELTIDDLDREEYAIFMTYFDAITKFGKREEYYDPEPVYLNRHWLMHGRRTRKVTKLDCTKVLYMIYGTIKMKNVRTNELNCKQ